jgi:hypothetical protein
MLRHASHADTPAFAHASSSPQRSRMPRHACAAPVIAVSPATAKLGLFRTPPMPPRKTALAIAALQSHSAPLDMRQRRVLILADGQRSVDDLIALGGSNAATIVQELLQQGYLDDGRPGSAPPSAAPTAANPAPADPRRALLNARMYLLDLLQLQRHPASRPLQQQLRDAREDAATLQAIAQALRAMPEMTSERYAQRIRERVLEVLPAPLHASLAAA